jgi:hypothetical protein
VDKPGSVDYYFHSLYLVLGEKSKERLKLLKLRMPHNPQRKTIFPMP